MSQIEVFTLDCPLNETPRKVWVYLPHSYAETKKKYDVLYMFDGHNLFSDETATFGKSWGMKEYLDETGLDLVVIGADCSHLPGGRMDEYCPFDPVITEWDNTVITKKGDITGEWFAHTLKPYCEEHYRIYKDRRHAGIGGSSMGGLMSQYMITQYNDLYSKATCVSSSTYFCMDPLLQLIGDTSFRETTVYTDLGSLETGTYERTVMGVDMLLRTANAFEEKGCTVYPNFVVGGSHNEASWEKIVPVFLRKLYPQLYK